MRTLLILRHGKSDWGHPERDDHDRPLAGRGKRDAPRVGRLLESLDLVPDLALVSTARRSLKTAKRVLGECSGRITVETIPDLYLASPETMAEVVRAAPDAAQRILVVGHEPGCSGLIELLTGDREQFPTAALAVLRCAVSGWSELAPGRAELDAIYRPRDLPPE